MRNIILVTAILILLLFQSSCSSLESEPVSLKVAVLPVLDTLPMHVALEQGYFTEEGVDVELVPVFSAPERDQLMQAGQIDGMLNEVVSTLFYNEVDTEIVIVRFARVATETYPLFRILASAESGVTQVEGLVGVPIGISEGTVIEYTTDRILTHAGLSQDQIVKIAVPKIPDRFALLQSGELDAANLPDPLASLAIQGGAQLVIDDTTYPEVSHSVISFSAIVVEEHPEAIEAFLRAIERAVDDINANKEKWSGLLTDLELVPPPLLESYVIPDFPPASVPNQSQFEDALDWAKEKELIEGDIPYSGSVDASFLPER
ncbi:MAG: ABC transporter substrate-binding protein [Anaerolineales bacterium]|nr:ABC transporter substrate-binding protein [Anaerolineales bacterium]